MSTPKPPCPRCQSVKVRRNSETKKGNPRWRCNDCGKSWTEQPRPQGRPKIHKDHAARQRVYKALKEIQETDNE